MMIKHWNHSVLCLQFPKLLKVKCSGKWIHWLWKWWFRLQLMADPVPFDFVPFFWKDGRRRSWDHGERWPGHWWPQETREAVHPQEMECCRHVELGCRMRYMCYLQSPCNGCMLTMPSRQQTRWLRCGKWFSYIEYQR